ncbi:MAG: 3-phosphoshikimate 1-carboxyvinyltransferase [Planctomycetaceae bacterium]|nr:3-phosphoshikimate 1-carboxyvinyltransferase [Planctomycetaceae bacterium]
MSEAYTMRPVAQPVSGTVRPPGSKSITNRALILAALARGTSELTGALDSDDTRVMVDSLTRLGIAVDHRREASEITVTGCAGQLPPGNAELWLQNSGTSIRFLTALCTLGSGTLRLDGIERMRERPIEDLVVALNALGANVRCELNNGCPPVVVQAAGLPGGRAEVEGSISSQYLSALLMTAPAAAGPVVLDVAGELVSKPYVEMTLSVMRSFGIPCDAGNLQRFAFEPSVWPGCRYDIEPDASAASYFLAAAAITGGTITIPGLSRTALQGDVEFATALEQMGCQVVWTENSVTLTGPAARNEPLRGIDIDMNAISDTAQTLSAVAVFADSPTTIRNVGHMRHKETDRITAVVTELKRTGVQAEELADGLRIYPGCPRPAEIQTYDDHRMAMSFSLLGLRVPGIKILDPGCTAKTYPEYFQDLAALCAGDFDVSD